MVVLSSADAAAAPPCAQRILELIAQADAAVYVANRQAGINYGWRPRFLRNSFHCRGIETYNDH